MDEYHRANGVRRLLTPLRRAARKGWHDLKYSTRKHEAFAPRTLHTPAKVIVVGSGISGLASALQLELRGHDVTILEAAAQIGGRASTIRDSFTDDLYADAGGFRFAGDHFLMREYIALFELPVEPFYPENGDMLLYIGGELKRRKTGDCVDSRALPRPLTDEEAWMLNQESDEHMYRICGGVDRFVMALADRLSGRIQLHSEVKKIIRHSSGVEVEYSREGETEVLAADLVVCAIPFSVLKNVLFDPELTDSKRKMIDSLEYRPGMLVYMQLPSEYWQEQNLNGFAVTDTVGEMWTYGLDNPAGKCVTISYTKDDVARELLAMNQEQRIVLTMERCGEFLPWFKDFVRERAAISWDEDYHIRGTRSTAMFLGTDQIATIQQPEKRIHFAGEHTATHQIGWMEGALESAHRVAVEISR